MEQQLATAVANARRDVLLTFETICDSHIRMGKNGAMQSVAEATWREAIAKEIKEEAVRSLAEQPTEGRKIG